MHRRPETSRRRGSRQIRAPVSKFLITKTWAQIDVAIESGVGAREIARNMALPAGTILSHLKRKAVSQRIQAAKNAAAAEHHPSKQITPFASAARTLHARGERCL